MQARQAQGEGRGAAEPWDGSGKRRALQGMRERRIEIRTDDYYGKKI
jgi:hypothetical protein